MAFHVEFYVDDKRLAEALRRLAGIAIAPGPVSRPVINATKSKGGLAPATNGELVSMFISWIRKHKLKEVSSSEARTFCTSIGKSSEAYSYLLRKATDHHALRRIGKGTTSKYVLVEQKGSSK